MTAVVKPATGRAKCRICDEKIKKGQLAVEVYGYQFSQQIHSSPEDCMYRGWWHHE